MASTHDSGLGHGTAGSPQETTEELIYPSIAEVNEQSDGMEKTPKYVPSPKHEPGHNWGTENPIKTQEEGQRLLDTGYHSYEVFSPPDIPPSVLKKMKADGRITSTEYKKYLKGKKR